MNEHFTGKLIGTLHEEMYFGTFLGDRNSAETAAKKVDGYVEDYGLQVDEINAAGEIIDANKVGGYSVWREVA